MELKKYKLGDVATIIVGYPFESERFNTEGKGILLVRGMNVSERYLRFGEEARWWDEITDKYLPYYLQENDVLIGMDGSKVGKNFAIVKKEDLPLLLVQRVACIRAKSGFDQHFIWQYVSSPRFIEYVNTIKTGSSIPHISGSQIANFPIFAPSFEIQKRIGSLLSNLDRKIALNRAINRNLEALAKQLYDFWFVQFDFPDDNGRPYKTSGGKMVWNEVLKHNIPVEWSECDLNYYIGRITNGLNPRKNFVLGSGNNYYVTIRSLVGTDIEWNDCDRCDDEALKKINSRSQLQIGDVIFSAIGTIGRTYFIQEEPNNWNISETSFTLRARENVSPYFFYALLRSEEIQKNADKKAMGSTLRCLVMDSLCKIPTIKVSDKIIERFVERVKPIYKKIYGINKENSLLTKQRDELLPLLMNGQVTIEN